MKKKFVKENESIVNAYHKGLGDNVVNYSVQHATIQYRRYLGDDQINAVLEIINKYDENGNKKYKRILIIAPTGSGKTTMMAKINLGYPGYSALLGPNKVQNLQNQELGLDAIVGGNKATHRTISITNGYSIVYDLADLFTTALKKNPSEPSIIIIDEPQELYYAKTYREIALSQISKLEKLSKELPTSSVIHVTATPDVLVPEKYDYILQFEDIDRVPVADKLDIIENNSKLSFEDGVLHLIIDMVKNKNEKVLIEIQSIEIINKVRDTLNSLGITAVSLSSEDKDNSSSYIDHQTGKLKINSYNDMYKAIVENSCLPKYTFNNKEISVYLATSILGQGSSIKGIMDENKTIAVDTKLVPVYTVKDKATCSLDYVLQFLARPRFHVNRAVVYMNKENYDTKIQECINRINSMPGVTIDKKSNGNYYITTNDVSEFKELKKICKDLGIDYEKYDESPVYKIVVYGTMLKPLQAVMDYHIDVAKIQLDYFTKTYSEFELKYESLDIINETIDKVLGLYCIDGTKNSTNIIKRYTDGLHIDKEILWLNIYTNYIGQYYRCNNLYYQELSELLEMPYDISSLNITDIDLKALSQNHQELIHESLSNSKNNDSGFKEKILKNQLGPEMKWLCDSEEFKYLSSLTKLTDDLDDAYEIISEHDIDAVKEIYDKKLREKFSVLTSKERLILEAYALTKKTDIPLDDVSKLIIDSPYWLHITRGLKLGISMETIFYQFGKAPSFEAAKNYIDKTQTVDLLKNHSIKELESIGRAGMEIVVAINMFYDINNNQFWDERNKVTKKDIDYLRIALNQNETIKSLRYDTSGIGKSGSRYTKKDAQNLLTCIFVLGTPNKKETDSGVLFTLLRIAKAAK